MARTNRGSGSRQQAAQTGAVTIILLYCIGRGRGRGRANSHSDCCFLAVMPLLDRVQHWYCFTQQEDAGGGADVTGCPSNMSTTIGWGYCAN